MDSTKKDLLSVEQDNVQEIDTGTWRAAILQPNTRGPSYFGSISPSLYTVNAMKPHS